MHTVVKFPLPAKPRSYNQTAGKHWTTWNREKKLWQNATRLAFLKAEDQLCPYTLGGRVLITIAIPVPTRVRRDTDNYYPTVVKPIKDGITQAGTLWPDDDALHCDALVVFWHKGTEVRVRVEEAPPMWNPADETP